MGQVRENSAEKNPLKKGKVAQFESDLLKANGDTCIALESHDIYRCLYGGGKFVPPTIQTYTFINVLGSFAKKLVNLLFSKTLLLDNHLLSAPVRVVALSNKLANRTGTFFRRAKASIMWTWSARQVFWQKAQVSSTPCLPHTWLCLPEKWK